MVRAYDGATLPEPVITHLRPAIIWLGIATFFLGTIGLGAALAGATYGTATASPAVGPVMLALGVGYLAVGFALRPSESVWDPDLGLERWQRLALGGLAAPFLGFALWQLATML